MENGSIGETMTNCHARDRHWADKLIQHCQWHVTKVDNLIGDYIGEGSIVVIIVGGFWGDARGLDPKS